MTTHITHVTVRDDGPPVSAQRIGAIYAIPGPEFKTYVPDYAPAHVRTADEEYEEEDSEVTTKVVKPRGRPARPKATTTAETKTRPRRPRTRPTVNNDETES